MDCSLPGSSVHGIFRAKILEWVAIPFSRGSSLPKDRTRVSCTAGRFFATWDPREAILDAPKVPAPNYYSIIPFHDIIISVMASILHRVADFSQLCRPAGTWSLSAFSPFACNWKITELLQATFEFPAQTIIALFKGGEVGSVCYHSRREGNKEVHLCVALKRKACLLFFRQFFKNRKIPCFASQIRSDWKKNSITSHTQLYLNVPVWKLWP